MSDNSFEVSLQGQAPTITIVLRGELTAQRSDAVTTAYRQATALGARNVVVDFAGVDFMNSAGIAQLINVLSEARKANQRLVFSSLRTHFRKLLTTIGLTRYVTFCDSLADAYQYLQSEAGN